MLDKPILVSDEIIKDVRPYYGKYHIEKMSIINKFPNYLTDLSECQLIIAGMPELPSIDFSSLSEEDCKKIGWVDVKNMAKKRFPQTSLAMENYDLWSGHVYGFQEGFKTAQSLNDKKFTEEDMCSMFMAGRDMIDDTTFAFKNSSDAFKRLKKSISEPRVFNVEVEMEKDFENHPELIGNPREEWEYPKIENNKIKITKIH